ncbi:unnamed protein product [Allacma fusca]|uniref:Uncharacterized protein n=1 Tax=Allacma fusca TaxID=39272 RepID=A0A8J2JSS3_9HEXA|nr:unnamed protein product [Allacma fusca]
MIPKRSQPPSLLSPPLPNLLQSNIQVTSTSPNWIDSSLRVMDHSIPGVQPGLQSSRQSAYFLFKICIWDCRTSASFRMGQMHVKLGLEWVECMSSWV